MMGRRLSRAMPPDATVDKCLNCPEWITFHFGIGWMHRKTGQFLCDWMSPESRVAKPEHWPS